MNTNNTLNKTFGISSCLLGNLSLWWGMLITAIYALGFALLLPQAMSTSASTPPLALPYEFPLIGLALAVIGGLCARVCHHSVAGSCLAGLVLNAIPLTLAIALRVIETTHG